MQTTELKQLAKKTGFCYIETIEKGDPRGNEYGLFRAVPNPADGGETLVVRKIDGGAARYRFVIDKHSFAEWASDCT